MIEYNIFLACTSDIKQINDISNYYIETSASNWSWKPMSLRERKKWFKKHNSNSHPIYVAKTKDDKVLGFCSLSPFRKEDGYWSIAENSIYVDHKYLSQNIGNNLMEKLINHAKSSKLEAITAWIDSGNTSSIDFHKKWDFYIVGEMKNIGDKFEYRHSVTIMQLSVL